MAEEVRQSKGLIYGTAVSNHVPPKYPGIFCQRPKCMMHAPGILKN